MPYDIQEAQKQLAELNARIIIDQHSLDTELVRQPALYNEVSQAYVKAMAQRDLLKQDLDLVKAQLDKRLRDRYTADGHKFTETLIANEVLMQSGFQNAQSEFSMWRHVTESLGALRDAMSQRAYALKDLAGLWTSGYYAEASVREPRGRAVDKTTQKVHDAIAEHEVSRRRL